MRHLILAAVLLVGPGHATAARDGTDWLARIVEAHFVSAEPAELRTLVFAEQVVVHAVGQSRRPGPPWDRSRGVRRYAIGFSPQRFAEEARIREAGGYDFHHRIVLDRSSAFVASFVDGYRRTLALEGAWPARTGDAFRRTPAWIVRELASWARAGLQPPDDGRRLRFDSYAGPVELAFDEHWRLARTTWQDGGASVEARFADYRWHDGVAVPRRVTLYWRGERVNDIRVVDVAVNETIAPLLRPPPDLPLLEMPDAAGARDFAVRELAKGLWLIGEAVHYQLFVELDDHVVALGSVGGVGKRLAALRERIGDKPLRHALITHHHEDHLEGVAELAAAGAVLLVAPQHSEVVRQAAGSVHGLELELVHDRKTLGDAGRTIEVIDIGPNVHAEHMLVGYLPAERLLWSADLFVQPPERPLRTAIEPIRALAEAIDAHDLDVQLLVDPHSPRINTLSDLRESVRKARAVSGGVR